MSKIWLSIACCTSFLWTPASRGEGPTGSAPLINPSGTPLPDNKEEAPVSVLPGRPGTARPTTEPADLLAGRYESQAAGIALRPPAGCVLLGRTDADHVATWTDESRNWTLKLSRITLGEPRPLTTRNQGGDKEVKGLLEITVDNLKRDIPGGRILRQDLSTFGEGIARDVKKNPYAQPNLGLVAMRYTLEGRRQLTQQAIFQANEYLYYVLTLTTPGNRSIEANPAEDPKERQSVEAFQQMIDSVELLDRGKIRRDQDERLYRTRSFFVNLTGQKLRGTLIPEQWFRVLKNGNDIGYTYIVEETAAEIPRPSRRKGNEPAPEKQDVMIKPEVHPGEDILIGVRSRLTLQDTRADQSTGPIQTDSESWFFVTADRHHEDWTRTVVVDDFKNPHKQYTEEFGASDRHLVNKAGAVREGRALSVQQINSFENMEPVSRELPPWYLPQAVSHLLPRLLTLKEPKTYMFAIFVSDTREVMERYVDVGRVDDFVLNGQRIHAIPVRDRVGLEGSLTTHYLSATPDAQGRYTYLGSDNKDTGITVIASDATTLQRVWSNPNLTRPRVIEPPPVGRPASDAQTAPRRPLPDLPAPQKPGQ